MTVLPCGCVVFVISRMTSKDSTNLTDGCQSDVVAGVSVFFLSLLLGWLLSLAYPEGVGTSETIGYWAVSSQFRLFGPGGSDWWSTPLYGFIMQACSIFGNPASTIYWLNTLIFSINCSLIFVLGRLLFRSLLAAIALAVCFLLFEFLSMRVFFFNVFVTPEASYAGFALLGALLSFIGWLRRSKTVFVVGYLILGLASFMMTLGVSLIPVWIVFALFVWWDWRKDGSMELKTLLISIAVLLAPIVLWSGRNLVAYGQAKNPGALGISLLKVTLPYLADQDRVMGDPKENSEFIAAVRRAESSNSAHFKDFAIKEKLAFWRGQHFFHSEPVVGPFDYLGGLKTPNKDERMAVHFNPTKMFVIDDRSTGIALGIIAAHPGAYMQSVFGQYQAILDPLNLKVEPYEKYQADPGIVYGVTTFASPAVIKFVYPVRNKPNVEASNRGFAKTMADFLDQSATRGILSLYYANQLWLTHLIFLAACATFGCALALGDKFPGRAQAQNTAVVLIFLFLTAISYVVLLALTDTPIMRIAMAGSDLPLHLMFFTALIAVVLALIRQAMSLGKKVSAKKTPS